MKNQGLKPIILLTNISIFIMLMFVFSCKKNKISDIEAVIDPINNPVETTYQVKIVYSDSANIKAVVEAPILLRWENIESYLEMPEGIKATFYDSLGMVDAWLTADYSRTYNQQAKFEAKENVVVVNQKGEKLETEYLMWDRLLKEISSNVDVKYTTETQTITGTGFIADERMTSYTVFQTAGNFTLIEDKDSTNNE